MAKCFFAEIEAKFAITVKFSIETKNCEFAYSGQLISISHPAESQGLDQSGQMIFLPHPTEIKISMGWTNVAN